MGAKRRRALGPSHAQTPRPMATHASRRSALLCPSACGGRQPTPSHAMMAAKGDYEEPARARRTWYGERGTPSSGKAAGPEGGPGTRRARRCPSGPHPRRRVLAGLPSGAAPPGCVHHRPPAAHGPAGRAGRRRPSAPRGPSLRALPGCASAPGAARAVGGEMGVCAACQQETPAGDAAPQVR